MPFHTGLIDALRDVATGALATIREDPVGVAQGVNILLGRSQPPTMPIEISLPRAQQPIASAAPGPQAVIPTPLPGGVPVPMLTPAAISGGFQFGPAPPALPAPVSGVSPGLFRPRAAGVTPARVVCVPHPLTGEAVFFGHLGRPLLFSRDLAAVRKVNRLARRARRAKR